MKSLKANIDVLTHYTHLKETGHKGSKQMSREVSTSLDEIDQLLSSGDFNKELTPESLEKISQEAQKYIDSVGIISHSKTAQKCRSVFHVAKKRRKAELLKTKASQLLIHDNLNRNALINSEIKELKLLIKTHPQECKQRVREFAMAMANGEHGTMRTSLSSIIQTMSSEVGDEHQDLVELLNSPTLFSSFEIKTGTLQTIENPKLRETIAAKVHLTSSSESGIIRPTYDLKEKASFLREQRRFRLINLRSVYASTINDTAQRVRTKYFPTTTAWYVGTCRSNGVAPFELEMETIASSHGMTLITDSTNEAFKKRGKTLTLDDAIDAAYPQDFVDFSTDEVRVPLLREMKYGDLIQDSIRKGRIDRNPLWSCTIITDCDGQKKTINPPHITIGWVDQVWQSDQSLKGIAIASSLEVQPLMNLTYSESGNTLIGQRTDGRPFVIIGQDSYDASKALMEHDLERPMTDQEVRMAFAIDYGVTIDDLYFVEQPGDFHLDMNMAIVGTNTIVLNDALIAVDEFEADLERWLIQEGMTDDRAIQQAKKEMRNKALLKKKFEDATEEDLKRQGFTVVRVAGRFAYKKPFSPEKPIMNFFNMVTATTPDDKRLVIAMGVTEEKYRERFRRMMGIADGPRDILIHHLDMGNSAASLALDGGISCRTKTL